MSLLPHVPFSIEIIPPRLCFPDVRQTIIPVKTTQGLFAVNSNRKFLGLIIHSLPSVIYPVTLSYKMPFLQLTAKAPFSLVPLLSDWSLLRLLWWFLLPSSTSNLEYPRAHSWGFFCIYTHFSGDSIWLPWLLNILTQASPLNSGLVCPLPGWHLHLDIQLLFQTQYVQNQSPDISPET